VPLDLMMLLGGANAFIVWFNKLMWKVITDTLFHCHWECLA